MLADNLLLENIYIYFFLAKVLALLKLAISLSVWSILYFPKFRLIKGLFMK